MPASTAKPPLNCSEPKASWKASAPIAAPTSGSRLTKTPASSGATTHVACTGCAERKHHHPAA